MTLLLELWLVREARDSSVENLWSANPIQKEKEDENYKRVVWLSSMWIHLVVTFILGGKTHFKWMKYKT